MMTVVVVDRVVVDRALAPASQPPHDNLSPPSVANFAAHHMMYII
jgi:hypothetical protein